MTNPTTKRFLVWRSYHKLKEELGRVPFGREIAEDCGVVETTVWRHVRALTTCAMMDRTESQRVTTTRTGYGPEPHVQDVVSLMHK